MYAPVLTGAFQSVEKPLSLSKNRVWGVAPRQVAGTPVPVFTPFPGERGGRGIGIINQKFISKTDFFYSLMPLS